MRNFKHYVLAAVGFALVMFALSGITPHDLAAQATKVTQVFVTNMGAGQAIPTAAQGTTQVSGAVGITGTPTVALAGGSSILVDNNTLNPIPVRDVDNPARHPFQAFNIVIVANSESSFQDLTRVPNGQRLVIEHVSLWGQLPTGQRFVRAYISTTAGGQGAEHDFVPVFLGPDQSGTLDRFAASQPVRLYADPGTLVRTICERNATTGIGALNFKVSGYLVDVP